MRKILLTAAALCLIVLLVALLARRGGSHPYNVVLISLDTLRADRVGAWGFPGAARTPELDRLAARSVLFENAFSTASVTTASHMSMFTGLHPPAHGLSDIVSRSPRTEILPPHLHPKIRTLPELLKAQGYRTARFVFGRDFFLDPSIGFGRGFDELYPYGLDSAASAAAIGAWLEKDRGEPFFAFIHSKRPHSPFVFPEETIAEAEREGLLEAGYKGPLVASQAKWAELTSGEDWSGNFIPGIMPDCFYFESLVRKGNPADQRRISQLYNLAVRETDRLLGRVLTSLERAGLLDSTIVVIASDHGEQFLEHGTLSHLQLHREETHVPLLLHLPASLRSSVKQARVSADVQTTDILPTVLDLLGLPAPKGPGGRSLAPLFRGEAAQVHDAVYSFNSYSLISRSSAIRVPGWTLILGEDGPKLYDRKADPGEKENLADQRPAELERLRGLLKLFEVRSLAFDPEGQ